MAEVELLLPASPEHVRTARLVVVAAARRAGLPDELVDELRLAVGEACARAVGVQADHSREERVAICVSDEASRISVTVRDRGRTTGVASELGEQAFGPEGDPSEVALAVLQGLVDDIAVERDPDAGTTVRMTWALPAAAARP